MSELVPDVIGPYEQYEVPAPIIVTFKDSGLNPIDLTGYAAEWHIERESPPLVAIRAAVVNADQVGHKGQVTYTWVSADFAVGGRYKARMWVGNSTNHLGSVPYVWATYPVPVAPGV